jgi:hypothetical protein
LVEGGGDVGAGCVAAGCVGGVAGEPVSGHSEDEGDGDEALLGAVVQVAFEAAAFGVLGGDESLA